MSATSGPAYYSAVLLALAPCLALTGCLAPPAANPLPGALGQIGSPGPVTLSVRPEITCTFPDLRAELLEMMELDQAERKKMSPVGASSAQAQSLTQIDACHIAHMKRIVRDYGWPTRSLVGQDGAHAAWLLVQHADQNPVFQSRCLDLMHTELTVGEVDPKDVAYLTDRVLVNQNKPQVYGTQFHQVGGKSVPRPIQDPLTVDVRRAEIGLSTMADYKQLMKT